MTKNFYDTCTLLHGDLKKIFAEEFYISIVTIEELEHIKTSIHKDEEVKYRARQVVRLLKERKNDNLYHIVSIAPKKEQKILKSFNLPNTNDSKIIIAAYVTNQTDADGINFVTNDLICEQFAKSVGLSIDDAFTIESEDISYNGYLEIECDDEELICLYGRTIVENDNKYGLLDNQYLVIRSSVSGKVLSKYLWRHDEYTEVFFPTVESDMFGKVRPMDNDVQQCLAIESLRRNQISMLRGPAGSGKSYLAFATMFDMLESNHIDKIIVFCNTVATKGSAKLGFYPGTKNEKLLDSQIGNLLTSKLGSRTIVEQLIEENKLILLPMSDIRGYDTGGMRAAIYISEAQNLDIELMRLALQRIGEDSICIVDGDSETQVDSSAYAGSNNGMRRVSEVFRGADFYGEVTLKTVKRSKIAALAQKM